MGDIMRKTYLLITLILVVSLLFGCFLYRPPIEQATIEEIQAIDGLGETLACLVFNYIEDNPNADIDDLIDIKGIGPKRIKLLKGKFR